jgi:hypothetical protein
VLPIVIGVAMASYGEMTATAVGSEYTLLCILLGKCSTDGLSPDRWLYYLKLN